MNQKSLVLIGFLLFTVPAPLQACNLSQEEMPVLQAGDKGFNLMENEALGGWLKLGLPATTILEKLGEPTQKGEDILWGAIGTYVQAWEYPNQGIMLYMESTEPQGDKTVLSITMTAPSSLTTSQGIGIGSPREAVQNAYGIYVSEMGESSDTLIAGSVYGGVMFDFVQGKVTRIFIGAAAE